MKSLVIGGGAIRDEHRLASGQARAGRGRAAGTGPARRGNHVALRGQHHLAAAAGQDDPVLYAFETIDRLERDGLSTGWLKTGRTFFAASEAFRNKLASFDAVARAPAVCRRAFSTARKQPRSTRCSIRPGSTRS